ncbi:MAG TPA: pilus assembly protein N-terminal domain-containing protein [Terriglobia bacterium]|nr:pilus assembly protein N-terminal domain-containing protein [Terriglobia bacterium]
MKFRLVLAILVTLILVRLETPAAPEPQAQVNLPQQGPTELRVQLGKSLLIQSQEELQRVSVTDPTVASAVVISPTQVLINGLKAGSGTLILWDSQDRPRSFIVTVELDINTLRESLRQILPGETIQALQSGGAIVLTGNASSKEVSDQAAALAGTLSPAVVNLVTTTESRQVILLQVKFAEIDRSALSQFGIAIFSTGAGNTLGVIGTHQFDQAVGNVGAIPAGAGGGGGGGSNVVSGGIGRTGANSPASFGFSDVLNIFLFRPDLNIGTAIRALQQKNVLQILAEPNVMAVNGTESSFLAGGEFPYPVVQGGATNSVTVQFKEFGIRLNFTPRVMPNGTIRLKVSPEVSALDFANGLTVAGFLVPALTSRKATTEVDLRDGQSFAIAGLMDNRTTEVASKVPVLADIPILGQLFRSRALNKTNTELLVMVTPRMVEALPPGQTPPIPEFPKPFLDVEKFDGKTGASPTQK